MKPEEIKAARLRLGLSRWHMATLLGYDGRQRKAMMDDLERGIKPLREPQRRLLEAYLAGYRSPDWDAVLAQVPPALRDDLRDTA
jgi:hypothetical protein